MKCELKYCIVEPYSDYGQVEHCLKTSTSLQFDGYKSERKVDKWMFLSVENRIEQ